MTPHRLAGHISRLKPHPPLSARFDGEIRGGKAAASRAWYSSQKEHWLGWLAHYEGPGAYGRKVWGGRDATFVYNHIVNPQMLMWLAEAAGLSPRKLQRARSAALSVGGTFQAMSAAIRRVVRFSDIEELLEGSRKAKLNGSTRIAGRSAKLQTRRGPARRS